jgi:replication factor A1
MTAEDIIEQIISTCPELSKEQVLERLETEKKRTGGFISDEALLRVIAAEYGCAVANGKTFAPALGLGDLIPGLSRVTVTGRIVAIFPSRQFHGARSGKLASLFIADRSGILRVVLWNDKTSLIESGELKVGQIVRLSQGYTRTDFGGTTELHAGEKCTVEINPKGVEAKEFPTISDFATEIGKLTRSYKNRRVNVIGTVGKAFPASSFERQDTTSGKVMRFMLADRTGEIQVVVWNDRVDELQSLLEPGRRLEIVNVKAKKAMDEGLELHVDAMAYVGKASQSPEFQKIADLKQGTTDVNIAGEIITRPFVRDVKTSKQELLKLATFELKDDTGRIRVSAWRIHAESTKDLIVGDKIIVRRAHVRKGFNDELELSTGRETSIDKNSQESEPKT